MAVSRQHGGDLLVLLSFAYKAGNRILDLLPIGKASEAADGHAHLNRRGLTAAPYHAHADLVGGDALEDDFLDQRAQQITAGGENAAQVASNRQIEGGGIRTHDLRIKSPLLYRLSYASV